MRNIKPYIAGIIIAGAALIPPINFAIKAPSEYWPWWVVMAGFAGFYTLFIKTNWAVRFVAIAGFINCFFSSIPYVSFTAYISLMACCYFYILCQSIKNYDPLFNILKCLMLFVGFMFVMQVLQIDTLLNLWRSFSVGDDYCFGVIGQHMQSASFSVILASALMAKSERYSFFPMVTSVICNSAGGFISSSFGLIGFLHKKWNKKVFIALAGICAVIFLSWLIMSGKFHANTYPGGGRLTVWITTLRMAIQRPLMGWGMSSYKLLFPALGGIPGIAWKTAHNCWIQMVFEFGIPITLVVFGYFNYIIVKLFKLSRRPLFKVHALRLLGGMAMISLNMCFHFPTRMIQTVLIMVFFLAYSQKFIDIGGRNGDHAITDC